MPPRRRAPSVAQNVQEYRHDDTRMNNPPAGIADIAPVPPAQPTSYMVYVSLDQWSQVKAQFESAPDAQLRVTGYPAYDPDLEGLAVFATTIGVT